MASIRHRQCRRISFWAVNTNLPELDSEEGENVVASGKVNEEGRREGEDSTQHEGGREDSAAEKLMLSIGVMSDFRSEQSMPCCWSTERTAAFTVMQPSTKRMEPNGEKRLAVDAGKM
eukprot:4939215-Pleurochrysis_carterae.AAC.1